MVEGMKLDNVTGKEDCKFCYDKADFRIMYYNDDCCRGLYLCQKHFNMLKDTLSDFGRWNK